MLKKLSEIKPGDILNENVYLGQLLILKRGMSLSPIFIKKLSDLGIEEVNILHPSSLHGGTGSPPHRLNDMKNSKLHIEQFFNLLVTIGTDKRYGHLLFEIDDLNFAETMFLRIMRDKTVSSLFYKMKGYDTFTWQHSFDVFLLGILLAKKIGLQDLEEIAIGFLLHDFGKTKITKEILDKPGKLTYEEFAEMKKHTLYGHRILTKNGFSGPIAAYAKSHHERLDGSGYPDGLEAKDLDISMRILMIADVYSALTLERPYRKAYSAQKAIQILLEDEECYDLDILLQLIDLMKIYPEEAVVKLSNNENATVVKVFDAIPTLPIIRTESKREIIKLPVDHSLTIKRLLKWKKVNSALLLESYTDALLHGRKTLADDLFRELTEHMKIEEMYEEVIAKSMERIGSLWEEGRISITQEKIASSVTMEILEGLSLKNPQTGHKTKGTVILAVPGTEKHILPLEMVAGILNLHGVKVHKLYNSVSDSELAALISEKNAICVCFSATMAENVPVLSRTCERLKGLYPDVGIIVGGMAVQGKKIKAADLIAENVLEAVCFLKTFRASMVS
ncbi:HD domain-containing phosphohydrolase [Bacillus sp. FJAT-27245]|uniref:HD domain-containing phosphohydrolase n=1 Tax=Bacillus sp. FJAT-27245 TaxID=1684144 RepID=UPI0006A7A815|nr:HD domain-containing phosphohydrolase [Bacillus sp. FJAT-27245]